MSIAVTTHGTGWLAGASMFYVTPCDISGLRNVPGLCRLRMHESGQIVTADELRALADRIEAVFGEYVALDDTELDDSDEDMPENYGGTD